MKLISSELHRKRAAAGRKGGYARFFGKERRMIAFLIRKNRGAGEDPLKETMEISKKGGGIIYQGRRNDKGEKFVKRIIVPGGYLNAFSEQLKVEDLDPAPSAAEYERYYGEKAEGFDWGRQCRGASQLAIALILDATHGNVMMAMRYHPDFIERFVAYWGEKWRINAEHIRQLCESKENYIKNGRG